MVKMGYFRRCRSFKYAACNLCMFIRLFKLLVSNSLKFYQTRKDNLGSKEQHLEHHRGVLYVTYFHIIHMVVSAWSICFHLFLGIAMGQ